MCNRRSRGGGEDKSPILITAGRDTKSLGPFLFGNLGDVRNSGSGGVNQRRGLENSLFTNQYTNN